MNTNVNTIFGATCEALAVLLAVIKGWMLTLKRLLGPSPPKSLRNEVILVTGGSSGIGRSILERITLKTDVSLISRDIDTNLSEAMIEQLHALGVRKVVAMIVDVKNKNHVSAAAAKVNFGPKV